MSELKPCPFCGRKPYERGGYVSCHTEECLANADYHEPAIGSIEDWNTRPIEDALNARIAELEKDLSNKEIEYTDLWDDALALQSRIAELEAERRWIPVSEGLPEIEEGDSKEYDVVITYPRESSVTVAWWTYNIFDKTHQRRIWTEDQGEFGHEDITKYVTHWRERPKPPEVQE
jgi:hypothetical protein